MKVKIKCHCERVKRAWQSIVNSTNGLLRHYAPRNDVKQGFTLAEVLITLTIIGIIAALTIPNLYSKYKKHVWAVSAKKAYSYLNNIQTAIAGEYGSIYDWPFTKYGVDTNNNGNMEIVSQFIEKTNATFCGHNCTGSSPNLCQDKNDKTTPAMKNLSGNEYSIHCTGTYAMKLKNGATMGIRFLGDYNAYHWDMYNKYNMTIIYDTNGIAGPNILGRDIFYFGNEIRTNKFQPYLLNDTSSCTKTGSGLACSAYLFKNGWKMDY